VAKGKKWEVVVQKDSWRIEKHQSKATLKSQWIYRLIDHEKRIHRKVKSRDKSNEEMIIAELLKLKDIREKNSCHYLADHWPDLHQVDGLLKNDPENANLRFCAVAHALRQQKPDWIIITGDLTDDGVGYDLIKAGLQPFVKTKRLVCIPGNHDLYPTPPLWTANALRKSSEVKKKLWADFASHLQLPQHGSYVMALSEDVLLAYFDSLHPGYLPASSSGHLPLKELQAIKQLMDQLNPGAVKLACLHHPILNMTLKELGLINYQPGMKLRNAKEVLNNIKQIGFSAVMKGHRHVGYKYHMKDGPLFLSAPSTTYGCRSGAKPFYWSLEINNSKIRSIKKKTIPLLAKEYPLH